jgi:hypothetical protein
MDVSDLGTELAMSDIELTGYVALANIRRLFRVGHAVFTVTKRHVPKWIAAVLTICLFIPGPLDEFLVLLVIAGMVGFKPAMRADLAGAISQAWRLVPWAA